MSSLLGAFDFTLSEFFFGGGGGGGLYIQSLDDTNVQNTECVVWHGVVILI